MFVSASVYEIWSSDHAPSAHSGSAHFHLDPVLWSFSWKKIINSFHHELSFRICLISVSIISSEILDVDFFLFLGPPAWISIWINITMSPNHEPWHRLLVLRNPCCYLLWILLGARAIMCGKKVRSHTNKIFLQKQYTPLPKGEYNKGVLLL